MPRPNLMCGSFVRRQVDVQARFGNEPLHLNRLCVLFARAVPKKLRRCYLLQFNIHRDRMPLISPDERLIFIERITLLVIHSYNLLKCCGIQWVSRINTGNQLLRIGPSVLIKCNPNGLGFVPQYHTDKSARVN